MNLSTKELNQAQKDALLGVLDGMASGQIQYEDAVGLRYIDKQTLSGLASKANKHEVIAKCLGFVDKVVKAHDVIMIGNYALEGFAMALQAKENAVQILTELKAAVPESYPEHSAAVEAIDKAIAEIENEWLNAWNSLFDTQRSAPILLQAVIDTSIPWFGRLLPKSLGFVTTNAIWIGVVQAAQSSAQLAAGGWAEVNIQMRYQLQFLNVLAVWMDENLLAYRNRQTESFDNLVILSELFLSVNEDLIDLDIAHDTGGVVYYGISLVWTKLNENEKLRKETELDKLKKYSDFVDQYQ